MSSDYFDVVKIFGEHLVEKNVLKKYPTVINAGVHQGQEMFDLMDIVTDIKIYALEPSRRCYESAYSQFKGYENINFIKKAIVSSNRKGNVEFTDFLSNGKYYDYGGVQDLSEFRSSGETYEVQTTNIKEMVDSINSDIGLFKADIEGAEYEIIMDFDDKISQKIKQIALEIQDIPGKSYSECRDDMVKKLESLNYVVYVHQEGDITNDKESTEIINGIEFNTGGLYAIKKEEIND